MQTSDVSRSTGQAATGRSTGPVTGAGSSGDASRGGHARAQPAQQTQQAAAYGSRVCSANHEGCGSSAQQQVAAAGCRALGTTAIPASAWGISNAIQEPSALAA